MVWSQSDSDNDLFLTQNVYRSQDSDEYNTALRGGQEHRNLRHLNSQLSVHTDKDGGKFLRYSEDVSKANQRELKHRKIKPKVVDAHENKATPSRCIMVRLYESTFSIVQPMEQQTSSTLDLWLTLKTTCGTLHSNWGVINCPVSCQICVKLQVFQDITPITRSEQVLRLECKTMRLMNS